jgi:HAD superfamily hydrolase (TIGR01490 family)
LSSETLAVFDLDGTITRHDTLLPYLAGYLLRHPWRLPRLLLILRALARYPFRRDRGILKGALVHAALGGLARPQLAAWSAQFVPRLLRSGLYREALDAIAQHRAHADRLVLMSASTELYVPLIAQALGFDESVCTRLLWRDDGRLDGHLATPNCRGEEKRRCLAALIARDAPTRVVAYGNAASDLPHLRLASQGFLVNAPARLLRGSEGSVQALRWSVRAGVASDLDNPKL